MIPAIATRLTISGRPLELAVWMLVLVAAVWYLARRRRA